MKAPTLRKGTRIRITKDARKGGQAAGKEGIFVGFYEQDSWLLFLDDGTPEKESTVLPDGYTEWNAETEDFPKTKCGMRAKNAIFLLDDGSEITTMECWWRPVNPKINKRFNEWAAEFFQKKLWK